MNKEIEKTGALEKFLKGFEKVANFLPTPFTIFTILFVITAFLSLMMAGVSATNPADGKAVVVKNFFTNNGLQWILGSLVTNFTSYAPLGMVLVMTLGIGLCQEVGLLDVIIKGSMKNMPKALLPYLTVGIGVIGQLASDSAQIIIPPLAGAIYLSLGKNPIVGVLSAFAGVGLGYLSNPIITTTDVLSAGITNTVLKTMNTGTQIGVEANWYFKLASIVFVSLAVGFVSDKFIEPYFGKYTGKALDNADLNKHFEETKEIKRGKTWALIALIAYVVVVGIGMATPGVLLHPKTGLIGSSFLKNIVPFLFALFLVTGLAYGFGAGLLKNEAQVNKTLSKTMSSMGGYIVMSFTAAQFMSLFAWTNIGTIASINGAQALKESGFVGIPLIVLFIIFVVLLDFFLSSSSAKWTLLAPIFVPMFSYLGYSPAFTQLAYRIGDAGANVFAPTSVFLWMLLDQCKEKYNPDLKIGNFLSATFVFMLVSQIGFILMLILFMKLNLPIGPGATVYLP